MEWIETDFEDVGEFVDTARLFAALGRIADAPSLYEVASSSFARGVPTPEEIDRGAFNALKADGFIVVPQVIDRGLERLRSLQSDTPDRDDLQETLDQLTELAQRITHHIELGTETKTRLLSQRAAWEKGSQISALEKQRETLNLKRRRIESNRQRVALLLQQLLDLIFRDPALREAHWYRGRAVCLTFNGRFLLDYLNEMNTAHFHGRSLADILEIGGSLA